MNELLLAGRMPSAEMPRVLQEHIRAMELLLMARDAT